MNAKFLSNAALPDSLQNQVDLLVDGELNEAGRAELFARLDQTPDGWKACAQTFLEQQMVAGACRATTQAAVATAIHFPRWNHLAGWAGIAAAVALAFGAGHFSPRPAMRVANSANASAHPAAAGQPVTLIQLPSPPAMSPAIDAHGNLHYSTREELPGFVLDALQQSGHLVQQVSRVVTLHPDSDAPLALPVIETLITPRRPL